MSAPIYAPKYSAAAVCEAFWHDLMPLLTELEAQQDEYAEDAVNVLICNARNEIVPSLFEDVEALNEPVDLEEFASFEELRDSTITHLAECVQECLLEYMPDDDDAHDYADWHRDVIYTKNAWELVESCPGYVDEAEAMACSEDLDGAITFMAYEIVSGEFMEGVLKATEWVDFNLDTFEDILRRIIK